MGWQLMKNGEQRTTDAAAALMNAFDSKGTHLIFDDPDTGQVLGGWWFERYTGPGGSVTAHWNSTTKDWIRRGMLIMMESYVFDQLAVRCVIGEVHETKTDVRAINHRMGFVEFGRIEGYFPDGAMILSSLTRGNFILNRMKALAEARKMGTSEAADG